MQDRVSLLTLKGHTNWVLAASFSSDGSRVVTASSDGTARMWDAKLRAFAHPQRGHTNFVRAVSFLPTAAASSPRAQMAPHGCGMQRPGPLCSPSRGTNEVRAASFLPTAAASSRELRWHRTDVGCKDRGLFAYPRGAHRWGASGKLFSGRQPRRYRELRWRTARMWDAKTGASLLTLKGHTNWVLAASFSPDGSRVVTASYDGTARMWDAKTRASLLTLMGHTNWVRVASFSSDGSRVVTASDDGSARLWDAKTGLLLMTFADHQER